MNGLVGAVEEGSGRERETRARTLGTTTSTAGQGRLATVANASSLSVGVKRGSQTGRCKVMVHSAKYH